jgi:hypothetical protein
MNKFKDYFAAITRRPSKEWVKFSEFFPFSDLLVTIFGFGELRTDSRRLFKRIIRMIGNNGHNYTFRFLKEVCRLVIHHLAGVTTSPVGFWIS